MPGGFNHGVHGGGTEEARRRHGGGTEEARRRHGGIADAARTLAPISLGLAGDGDRMGAVLGLRPAGVPDRCLFSLSVIDP